MTRLSNQNRIVVRGAGEMASAVIRRLFVAGFEVLALEKPEPECIRRTVCFAEAVHAGEATVEEVTAVLFSSVTEVQDLIKGGKVPLLIDPDAASISCYQPFAVVDGRMLKKQNAPQLDAKPFLIGLGPGFVAGQNCQAAVETKRGFNLGRVFYQGGPAADTGEPTSVNGFGRERVLRAPAVGTFHSNLSIGAPVEAGQLVGEVAGEPVHSQISGLLRGLLRNGTKVEAGWKIADVDPRGVRDYCFRISAKANAIAGGVLEAVLVLRGR